MYNKILVPTDGSELSNQAVTSAIDFARLCHAQIVALSIAEPYPMVPAAEGAMVIDPGFETRTLQELAQQTVDKVAKAARAAGLECTALTAVSMAPADEIIHVAKEQGCDLIFMASHGRRGLSKLLAGSVTQNVLAYSTIPVMVLRPRAENGKLHVPESSAAASQ
ncbi:universal stress protein [Massilia solisilvae]|uniref:Universal stress protein n=1 Tax=Massilia solisilvae TaxID=1811225 RepID=A0ABT2BGV3_9BURK|nr:universal stress protein [Massilia solisilvae]MCS0607685.1 universal stress protein [Massilia solisilvae]